MTRAFRPMMLAALVFAASCSGTSGGTDGGGGATGGSGGHPSGAGGATGGSGGHPSGAGGATGGSGGHGTGGQGGIDNLCLSEGQGCGTLGPMCCSGLSCCYGSNGQASCLPGSCTGIGTGGASGESGHPGTGGASGGGSGGAGGNQMYSCGSETCTAGQSFCYSYTPGTAGSTGRSCHATPSACASAPTSCACLCPPSPNAALGCVPVGMSSSNFCVCSDTGGLVGVSCAGS